MDTSKIKIGKQYVDNLGNIVTKNKDGVIGVFDGYQTWRFSKFIKDRQEEILNNLKEI